MKRIIMVVLPMLLGVFLQSCTVNTEFVFHKDNTISTTLEVETKSDSLADLSSDNKKLPSQWTSLYELSEQRGEEVPADSVEILKRSFVKGLYQNDKNTGFGIRFERMTDEEWSNLGNSQKQEEKMISSLKESSLDWNGKTLTFNVEELFSNNSLDTKNEKKKKLKEDNLGEQVGESMLKAFDIQINLQFKFENKIKTIKGKNQNFKQLDDYTTLFSFNIKDMMNDTNKKKKYDKKIVIITE